MIKKFIASNVEMAQAKATRALGDGVIVLYIRDLPSGDIELTAGHEQDAADYYRANPDHQPQNKPIQPHTSPHPEAFAQSPAHKEDQFFADDTDQQNALKNNNVKNNNESISKSSDDEQQPRSRKNLFPFFSKKPTSTVEKIPPTTHQNKPSREDNPIATPLDATPSHNLDTDFTDVDQKNRIENSAAPYEEDGARSAPPPNNTPPKPAPPLSIPSAEKANLQQNHYAPSQGSRLNEPLEKKFSENALSQLRERLTGQQHPNENFYDDPTTQSLVNILKPHGISDRLLSMILNGARKAQVDDDLYRMGIGFSESFNFSPLRSSASVPIMLVGPTGAGKTSCAAKLAALALSQDESAIMITTDVGRAGALEQFATYSEKLEIECYAAETPEEIVTIMREANPNGAVILDTPGISPYDAGDLAALKSYQTAIGAEPILVLPASGDVGEYTDWAHAFRAFGVRSCIITKFDATRRVGAGLSAAFEGDMTLTYFSETPFISEGLLPASPEFLAYRLMANYPGRIVQN